jgi:hypothetical protein
VLGNYLVAHANRIEGGFQLLVGGTRSNYALYQVLKHSDRHGQNSRNSHNSPNEHDSGEFGEFGEFSDPRSKTCAACKNYTPAPDNDGGTCAYHESAVEYPAAHTCSQWETAS